MVGEDTARRDDLPAPLPETEAVVVVPAEAEPADHGPPVFSRDGYLVTGADGVILEGDATGAALLGCPAEFLIGRPLGLLVAESHRHAFYDWLSFGGAGRADVLEVRVTRSRAQPRDLLLLRTAVSDPQGRLAGYRWLLRDVSAARRVEQTLRTERQLLDSVVNAAEAIILLADPRGVVLRANRHTEILTGFVLGELYGRPWWEVLLPPAAWSAANALFHKALASGWSRSTVLPLRTRTGEPPREVTWSARRLPAGALGGVVLIGYDVSELQQAQRQALQSARLAAIGQMAAGIAHESRNALQRLQACLSMLSLRVQGQADALDLLGRAQKAQDDLQNLFEDVLGYAAGPSLRRAEVDLATVWREAWADVAAVPGRAEARLLDEAGDTELTCDADRFQLKRVFRNLFENAVAAAPAPAEVRVRARPTQLAGRAAVEVSVRDNGPGFPPEVRQRLFEPFLTTKPRGTGLGLAICRRIIDAHGGRIEAGEAGPGAEVLITLPRRMP